MKTSFVGLTILIFLFFSCGKKSDPPTKPPLETPKDFFFKNSKIDNLSNSWEVYKGVGITKSVSLFFNVPIKTSSVSAGISLFEKGGRSVSYTSQLVNGDSTVIITASSSLQYLTTYSLFVGSALTSTEGVQLKNSQTISISTSIDSSDKFVRVSDDELLTLIQKQTFKYFWDFGHPVSGMSRERNTSGDLVTTGGTGFGVMSIIVGIERNFISRAEGLQRVNTIVDFLKDKCTRYHGAFAHWINGATGATIPFSPKDNGADLVETSLLMQGLLTARQYFSGADATEVSLRNNINTLWDGIDWNWFRNGSQNVLYWHWSPDYNFEINLPISGWNESLIVYALAASSNTHSIPSIVYDNGWARNGAMKNGNSYYGIQLPLGPALGGPLFFSQYSFLGLDPNGLTDIYANYFTQNASHSMINYQYCVANPKNFYGYSASTWGLTASDDNKTGYSAHAPDNDDGVITPTAAISSLPYTPDQSLAALRFFYYKLGDKLFKEYGFIDAFNLSDLWFADSFLAIDQGPQIIMIENYRTKLLWNLLMSSPELKTGMKKLGFQSPHF
ncbi:MAG: glucoamylase family protein [Ginsengibacter sp.]